MVVFDSVTFQYKNAAKPVFQNVSFSVNPGELVCVVGVNGSGKTTIARLAAGLLSAQQGRVQYLKDNNVSSVNIGYVQQRLQFSRDVPLTVYDIVMMGRLSPKKFMFTKEDHIQVQAVIKQCEIDHLANKTTRQLSGGQFQKVLIARLIACEPDLVIMDEPAEFLDVITTRMLIEQVNRLRGIVSFLIISHDMNVISELADRILCIGNAERDKDHAMYITHIESTFSHIAVEYIGRDQ